MKVNELLSTRKNKSFLENKPAIASFRLLVLAAFALFFSLNCAAGDVKYTVEAPANFWLGLWHGAIAGIAFIISLFSDTVRVYEIHNNGAWYDFGFLFGVVAIWGGGSAKSAKYRRGKWNKKWDSNWERKCETKMEEIFKDWAEEDDKEWEEIGKKIEVKLKRKIKDWANSE